MAKGTHDYVDDPRNAQILINVNGELLKRDEAKISVFDSGFILGDGVWEGLRVHKGRIAFLDAHLTRLYEGAKTLDMDIGISMRAMAARLSETLAANEMHDDLMNFLMSQEPVFTSKQMAASLKDNFVKEFGRETKLRRALDKTAEEPKTGRERRAKAASA